MQYSMTPKEISSSSHVSSSYDTTVFQHDIIFLSGSE
jgi:hypothetical protein